MIHTKDRSGYFGASDTKFVMRSNHSTKSWIEWWEVKLGSGRETANNKYTHAGTVYEHPILDTIDESIVKDGQIIIEDLLLRVNYDGFKDGTIYEIKTHNAANEFKVTKDYYGQCQVEMYAYQEMTYRYFLPDFKKLYIVSYPLYDDEYYSFEPEIDANRLNYEEIKYDEAYIEKYLSNLKPLIKALKKGKYPK